MLERWNTHFSTVVEQELFGIEFQLCQDPNSNNLGTTVWDASIVLAKYIQANSRRGDFARPKVRGKRALELGAGMGLAGMAMALLGAEVVFTDIGDVLPLLQRNVDQNISKAALKLKDAAWAAAEVGPARVASLDWSEPACFAAFQPPYDFILAADCVYSELAVPHLLATVLHMGGPRTQTIVTNEFRSQTVHDLFMQQFGQHFTIRKVPAGRQDPGFQHPLIHIYLLKRRKQPLAAAADAEEAAGAAEAAAGTTVAAAVGQEAAGQEAAAAIAGAEGAAQYAAAPSPQPPQQQDLREAAAVAVDQAPLSEAAATSAHPREAATGGAAAEAGPDAAGEQEEAAECSRSHADVGSQESKVAGGTQASGISSSGGGGGVQQFQTRRQGAMLARMLKDVKL